MGADQQERERLQRLKEAQIKARDPGPSKIRNYDWQRHAERGKQIKARQKAQQKPLLIDLYLLLPHRYRGALIGIAIGLVPAIIGALLLTGDWVLLAVIPPIVCGILGFALGIALDADKTRY